MVAGGSISMGFIPEFDIELPSWLDWAKSFLQWPLGSATEWWGIESTLRAFAVKVRAYEPELAGVRTTTLDAEVFAGHSAKAFDKEFAKVFGGDASLPKSVDALHALADTAEGLGDQIQATKLGNITLGAWAVGQLAWLAASAVFTGGASEAEVPVVEAMTEAASREIAERFGIPPFVAHLLLVRGVTDPERISEMLLSEDQPLSDPLSYAGMDAAVRRLTSAIDKFERVAVFGDYDVDGVTATSLLFSYLESLDANVIYVLPSRDKEGYGLHNNEIDQMREQ